MKEDDGRRGGRVACLGIPEAKITAIFVNVAVGVEETFPMLPRDDEGGHRGSFVGDRVEGRECLAPSPLTWFLERMSVGWGG